MNHLDEYNDILPKERMEAILSKEPADYENAIPFPHAVFDGFFPEDFLRKVADEFPDESAEGWQKFNDDRQKKLASKGDEQLGPYARALIHNLNSGSFIKFLETLTGIDGLIPDPNLVGGGMHRIQPGGKLAVHVDFNKHNHMKLDRRINVLVYLNEDWDESYGGHFELWNESMTESVVKVLPLFNRMALFSTTEKSWHGHPEPLKCPENRSRRSIALYYYTAGRDDGFEKVKEHSTIFRERPGEELFGDIPTPSNKAIIKKAIKKVVPQSIIDRIKNKK
jgi:Rps23 Pro-64 3,4-dihydroxylase Tpa1-like proline 4-hydroxylase